MSSTVMDLELVDLLHAAPGDIFHLSRNVLHRHALSRPFEQHVRNAQPGERVHRSRGPVVVGEDADVAQLERDDQVLQQEGKGGGEGEVSSETIQCQLVGR